MTVSNVIHEYDIQKDEVILISQNSSLVFPDKVGHHLIVDGALGNDFAKIINLFTEIEKYSRDFTLWMSDFIYATNNYIYTRLAHEKRLKSLNLFDEGSLIYQLEDITRFQVARRLAKFLLFKLRYRHFSKIPHTFRQLASKIDMIFLYHNIDCLPASKKKKISFFKAVKLQYLKQISGVIAEAKTITGGDSFILLSGPYHRHMSATGFQRIVAEIKSKAKERGFKNFFVKMHHTETQCDYEIFYKQNGFVEIFRGHQFPMELLGGLLDSKVTIASINSSFFLNARLAGFKNPLVICGALQSSSKIWWASNRDINLYFSLLVRLGVEYESWD